MQAKQRGVPGHWWRFDATGDVPNRSDARVVAMCRCLE
jgi:hypothetical protein